MEPELSYIGRMSKSFDKLNELDYGGNSNIETPNYQPKPLINKTWKDIGGSMGTMENYSEPKPFINKNKTWGDMGGSMGTMENYSEPKPYPRLIQPILQRRPIQETDLITGFRDWISKQGRMFPAVMVPDPRGGGGQVGYAFAEYLKSIGLRSIGGGMMPQRQPIQGPIQNQNYLYGGNSSNPLINNYPIQQNVGVPTPSYSPSQPQSGIAYLIRRLLGYQI